jgi:hypothetical protein
MKMKIEAVTVCINYSDFLAHTLPHNKNHFDNMVIVTDTKDINTKKICEYYNVRCVQTDVFYEDGSGKINKGKGINEGLKHLDGDGWVVHMDADIYLPPLTRSILEKLELDKETIYGIDRMMCPTYKKWIDFLDNPSPLHEGWIYVHTTAFPLGVRIAEYKNKGWEPIGFFQMWNPKGSGVLEYPKNHGSIDRSDVLFAKNFSRAKRQLIPEIISIHIDSEEMVRMGKNWNGRQTVKFSLSSFLNNIKSDIKTELPIVTSSNRNYIPCIINYLKEHWVTILGLAIVIFAVSLYIGVKLFNI